LKGIQAKSKNERMSEVRMKLAASLVEPGCVMYGSTNKDASFIPTSEILTHF